MEQDLRRLGWLIWHSFLRPGPMGRVLLAQDPGRGVLWQGLALAVILSTISVVALGGGQPLLPLGPEGEVAVGPWAFCMILGAALVLLVFALFYTGRALGGTGSFAGSLIVVIWFEVLSTALRLAEAAIGALIPPLIPALILGGGILMIRVILNLINELHGFDNLWRSALVLGLAVLGIGFGFGVILAVIGAAASGGLT